MPTVTLRTVTDAGQHISTIELPEGIEAEHARCAIVVALDAYQTETAEMQAVGRKILQEHGLGALAEILRGQTIIVEDV